MMNSKGNNLSADPSTLSLQVNNINKIVQVVSKLTFFRIGKDAIV